MVTGKPPRDNVSVVPSGTVEGMSTRSRRAGPEAELVDRFAGHFPRMRPNRSERVTLFREPRLPSGFPDLVAVAWREETTARWAAERTQLSTQDLRGVHLLATSGPLTVEGLLGLNFRAFTRRLDLLVRLGMLVQRGARWASSPLRRSFAVRDIVTFEAKIADMGKAIEQACVNMWFASESYVLSPHRPQARVLQHAAARGVGFWIAGESRPLLPARKSPVRQPVSFASWLFNEWAWRASIVSGGCS